IGSADGKKFKKIAQQHHLDILVEYANVQLEQLSKRYTLKRLDNTLSLLVIDHDMDDDERSVASLSGGEHFLVSLALALGIAQMASSEVRLDTLFIDEGFGTLDQTSLSIVMDVLDRLHSQGKKIVLISHIKEIHERIPVQIQLKCLDAGRSQVVVTA
ncbi:MAG: SbcC/MukB-like Walker B domain-containing protein, partial [Acinetobacter sp.]|nr:SbcC/MukB-like Walker B domain-containing protein [Acinetobacter sp.]